MHTSESSHVVTHNDHGSSSTIDSVELQLALSVWAAAVVASWALLCLEMRHQLALSWIRSLPFGWHLLHCVSLPPDWTLLLLALDVSDGRLVVLHIDAFQKVGHILARHSDHTTPGKQVTVGCLLLQVLFLPKLSKDLMSKNEAPWFGPCLLELSGIACMTFGFFKKISFVRTFSLATLAATPATI